MIGKLFIAFILASYMFVSDGEATVFRPISLEKLIEESNGAAEVELKSKKSFMNNNGMIFTEYSFLVLESYNLETSDLEGDFLKLQMVGGTVNGVTSYIDSAPEFEVGEKSFLLLKKIESKIYLSNFTMGKYKVQTSEGKPYYISSVFPNDEDLGKVAKERMIALVKLKFKITEKLKDEKKENLVVEVLKNDKENQSSVTASKRSPAQIRNKLDESSGDGLRVMWFFFSLFTISAITIWWKLKNGAGI